MNKDATWPQLKTFLRIVERGSLSAAARDMGTTQPTVSRQLMELESAYGATLMLRTTRSLHLTEAGRQVYALARLVLQADDALREQLQSDRTQVAGHLRIAGPSGFGALVLVPFCSRFLLQHPQLTLDLCLSDAQVDLISEGVDVAIRIGQLTDSSLYARPLARLEEVLVGHPQCITHEVKRPGDLANLPWVAFSGLVDGDEVHFERKGRKQSVAFTPRLRTDQIVGHREALLAGAGVGLIHRYAVDADLRAGRLLQLLPDWNLPQWPVYAVFPIKAQTHRLQRWCDALRQALAGIPGVRTDTD